MDRPQESRHCIHLNGRRHLEDFGIQVGSQGRFSGPQEGGGEKKYEDRFGEHLDQYYDQVISELGQPEALLIFGPGEAKLQLKERLSRSKSESIVGVETSDRLTDPQIVAKVKEHYGIDR